MSTHKDQIRQDYIRSKEREAIDRRYGKILAEEQRKFIKEERMRRQHAIHLMDSNSKLNRQIETLEHMNADIDQYNRNRGEDPNLRPDSAGVGLHERIRHGTQQTLDAEAVAIILMNNFKM